MKNEINHIMTSVERIGERRDRYRQDLRKHQVTPPLLLVLRLLESRPGLTMVELARMLGISVPTMQSRIERLENLGLIARKRSDDDRRKVSTDLSNRGRSLLRRVPLAGAGRLLDALEKGEITTRRLRRLAEELGHVVRLLFPEEGERGAARSGASIWRR
jgi:DNA-binding MarR family transcriptional regulator